NLRRRRARTFRGEAGTTMRSRILTLIWKEFVALRRSPQLLRLVLIAPVLQLTVLGYAVTTDVENVPSGDVDGDRSPRSRQVIERFAASPYFDIVHEAYDPRDVEPLLAGGRAWLAIVVPSGLGRAVDAPVTALDAPPRIQVIADGTD